LQRDAALFFEGTVGLEVQGCVFERLDGIALMLSGYTRNATILENAFTLIGDSVIASWGYTRKEQVGASTLKQRAHPNRPLSLPATFSFGLIETSATHPARSVAD